MIKFIRTTFFSFTIWLTAGFINGALFVILFVLTGLVNNHPAEGFGLATVFTLLFSAPAAFCLWLVFIIQAGTEVLSARLLKAAFILSLFSCLWITILPDEVYKGHWLLLSLMIITSSLMSVLLHHPIIRSFKKAYDV